METPTLEVVTGQLARLAAERLGTGVESAEIQYLFALEKLSEGELLKLYSVIEDEKKYTATDRRLPPYFRCHRYEWNRRGDDLHLSIIVCLRELAKYRPGFPELEWLPSYMDTILANLGVRSVGECNHVRKPVHASQLWCNLNVRFETVAPPTRQQIEYAVSALDLHDVSGPPPAKICVHFVLEDEIDSVLPWGSAPLLHVGANYKVPADGDACYVYRQKKPTFEITSKLNEVSKVIDGFVNHSHHLFRLFATGESMERDLAVLMAVCHPKTRVRIAVNAYVTCYLSTKFSCFDGNLRLPKGKLAVGRNMEFFPMTARKNGDASTKLSLRVDTCRACTRKCARGDHPAHDLDGISERIGRRSVPDYETADCKRSAVAHHFFCDGVVPCALEGISDIGDEPRKDKLVVYGRTWEASGAEDDKKVLFQDHWSKGSFFDCCLEQSCDRAASLRYLKSNYARATSILPDRWPRLQLETRSHLEASRAHGDELRARRRSGDVGVDLEAGFGSRCMHYNAQKVACLNVEAPFLGIDEDQRQLRDLKQARMHTLMNRCVVVYSRTEVAGCRGVLSRNKFYLHQFVAASEGMVVAPVSKFMLSKFFTNASSATAPSHDIVNIM